ncbi:MAG: PDK repeat-containing protein, partial [Methanohalophilus sp.]
FKGIVIARDGFEVTSGGSEVTFKNIDQYITDPEDYPF